MRSRAAPDAKERRTRTEELLEELNIAHIRKSFGYMLSGGERRRCEIAQRSQNMKVLFRSHDEENRVERTRLPRFGRDS